MRRPLSLSLSQKLATVHDINPSPLPQRAATCYLYPAPSAKRNYTEVVRGAGVRGAKASVNLPREGSKVSARNFSAPLRSLPAEHIVITAWVNFGEAVVAG